MTSRRIQRRRTKGWRAPKGAIYVGRGSKWGNPFIIETNGCLDGGTCAVIGPGRGTSAVAYLGPDKTEARQVAVDLFSMSIHSLAFAAEHGVLNYPLTDEIRATLAGHDLMCWCPLDQPCHADVLLEIANGGDHE